MNQDLGAAGISGLGYGGLGIGVGQLTQRSDVPEPNLISFQIERMVNGYIVEVVETNVGSQYGSRRGPRHLVTSREMLIELLTQLSPRPLTKPAPSSWYGQPTEEKRW